MKGKPTTRILIVLVALLAFATVAVAIVKFGINRTPARVTFLISGKTMGFLENCGCSGGQAGGVHRRATMIRSTRESVEKPIVSDAGQTSETLTLDTGDFSDSSDARQTLRSKGIVKAMAMMDYDAVGFGQNELTFEQKDLLDMLKQGENVPYVCANLKFVKPETGEDHSAELSELVEPFRLVKLRSGYKIGVIHVLDNSGIQRGEPIAGGYQVDDPVAAVDAILKEHGSKTPFWVLSVGTNEQFGLRNEKLTDFDLLKLVFGMRGYQPEGGTDGVAFPYFVDKPMEKGKDVTQVTVTFAEQSQLRVTALKVGIREDSYKPAEDIAKMIAAMQPQFKDAETEILEAAKKDWDPNVPLYVGVNNCATCHVQIATALAETPHMHAYETLKKQDKEHTSCAVCHNNGFNEPGGFNVIDDAKYADSEWPQRNVQCETCHGPGEFHVKLQLKQMEATDPKLTAAGRDQHGLVPASRETCLACHDAENSPNFNFDKYWPFTQHDLNMTVEPMSGHPEGAGMGGPMSGQQDGHEGHNHSSTSFNINDRRDRVIASLHALM
jgi:ferredoxin